MTQTRSYEPSPQRIARARARGDVARSGDLVSAGVLALACGCVVSAGPQLAAAWLGLAHATQRLVTDVARDGARAPLGAAAASGASVLDALVAPLKALLSCLVPWACALVVCALLASWLQTGFGWHLQRLRPRLRPVAGGAQGFERAAISSIKPMLLTAALCQVLWSSLPGVLDSWQRAPLALSASVLLLTRALLLRAALALVAIGLVDLLLERMRLHARLRMTRREYLDEQRQDFGEPRLRAERRQRAWQPALSAQHAALGELEHAALVVHHAQRALALRYAPPEHAVPCVWLKASADLAADLINDARARRLPVHDDAALVAALFALELTEAVPAAHYARVAALLTAARA